MYIFKKHNIVICFIILATILVLNSFITRDEQLLTIHMINVEQGDCILIITPNKKTILIDAGDTSKGSEVVSYLKKNKIKNIDILIATHPHTDHIGGISFVIENFEIKDFYIPPVVHTTKTFENMLISAQKRNLKISSPPIGSIIEFDDNINLFFLSPLKDYGNRLNNWSLVLKLDYLHRSFLFTGDLEYEAEIDIINAYSPEFLNSNLLKVGHHGSNSSSSDKFLNVIRPEIAMISAGINNAYNHPHEEVIKRLSLRGINLYRTDIQGTIVVKSDGIQIWSHTSPFTN